MKEQTDTVKIRNRSTENLVSPSLGALAVLSALLLAFGHWSGRAQATHPQTDTQRINYVRDVKPLLTERCSACHANGTRLGGLDLTTRDSLLKGGQSGASVVPGKSRDSLLIKLVSGVEPARLMPARGKRLTPDEIALLRVWIDQGANFEGETKTAAWTPLLAPRRPDLPPVPPKSGLTNPIDRLLLPYRKANPLPAAAPVEDRLFVRRVYLDLIGLIPTPEEQHRFLADTRPDKRQRLVQELLAQNDRYAEHWLTFWNDMLRNDYTGTGYIDGGRTQITGWLYNALITNLPYDRFVAELVNPTPESAGFIKGIVWRGVVNASQTPEMQASQNISQVFLGINMKCASCHDSFISAWKLADAYGLAGVYADRELELVRCDRPTGTKARVKFLYPELGTIDAAAPRAVRLQQLASLLTSKANGRLARTLVNRLWAKLMGRGLVEPADDMDSRPWNPDLLDWLAADFVDNGCDIKRTLALIATSRAYQMPAMNLASERAENFVFRGPVVKRMSAEQFVDALSRLTGVWSTPAQQYRILKGALAADTTGRARVRFDSGLLKTDPVTIDVDISGAKVLSLVVTDGGDRADYDWADWAEPRLVTLQGEIKLTSLTPLSATTGYGQIQRDKNVTEKPIRLGGKVYPEGIGTHATSIITYVLPENVTRFRATAGPDSQGVQEGGGRTSIRLYVVTGDRSLLETRAALANNDSLLRALERPNREQVVTQRQTAATTLQALELTNGKTFARWIERGAETWAALPMATPADRVDALYTAALGRKPTAAERTAALELLGVPPTREGIEDLLWSLTLLPEFQLIY